MRSNHLVLAGALAVAACADPPAAPVADDLVRLELEGAVDESGRLRLTVRAPGGLSAVPVDRDGVAGAGADDTVELVTRSVAFDLDCGSPDTLCAEVELGSFFAGPLADTCARITSMSPAIGFEPLDASAPSLCPASAYGNFDYGLVLGRGARTVRWTFRRAAGQRFTFRGDVQARRLPGVEVCDPRLPVPLGRAAFGFVELPAIAAAVAGLEVDAALTSPSPSQLDVSLGHLGQGALLQARDATAPGCPPDLAVRYADGAAAPAGTCSAASPGIAGPQAPLVPLGGFTGAPLPGSYGLTVSGLVGGTLDRFCVRARGNVPPAIGPLGGADAVRALVGAGSTFVSSFSVGDDDPDQSLAVAVLPTCPAGPAPNVSGDPSCYGQPSASWVGATGGGPARPLDEGVPAALQIVPPFDLDADPSVHCACVAVDDGVESRTRMARVVGRRARGAPCGASSVCVSATDRAADPSLDTAMTIAGLEVAPFCATRGAPIGYCCESACDGPCQTCAQPGQRGTCQSVAPNTEDAACGAYTCGAAGCRASCTQDTHCATSAGYVCNVPSGECVLPAPNGDACGSDGQCASGFCSSLEAGVGVCCDARCGGACETCRGATPGFCEPRPLGAFVPGCSPYRCDGDGRCQASCDADTQCLASYYCDVVEAQCFLDAPQLLVSPVPVTVDEDQTLVSPGVEVFAQREPILVLLYAGPGATLATTTTHPDAFATAPGESLALSGSVLGVNVLLRSLSFRAPTNAVGAFALQVWFGSLSGVLLILVSPVNDAPVISAPPTVSVPWPGDAAVAGLSVSDPDIPSGAETVRLSVARMNGAGLISVLVPDGVLATPASGGPAAALTLEGPLAQINLALSELRVVEPEGCGETQLLVAVDDLGNVGASGPLATARTTQVEVLPCDAAGMTCPDGTPITARLSDDYAAIDLRFGAALVVSPGPADCGTVLSAASLGALGVGASCAWLARDHFRVSLGGGSTVGPSSALDVLGGAALACTLGASVPAGVVPVDRPTDPLAPNVTITGADRVDRCPGTLVLTTLATGGGAPLGRRWTFPPELSGLGLDPAAPVLSVPTEAFPAAGSYEFSVEVSNAWGVRSEPAIHNVDVLACD